MSELQTEIEKDLLELAREYRDEERPGLHRKPGEKDWSSDHRSALSRQQDGEYTRRKLNKTGSQLDYLLSENENLHGVIINTIPTESTEIWQKLHDGDRKLPDNKAFIEWGGIIPVAPILSRKNGEPRIHNNPDDTSTVFSRYSGFSIGAYGMRVSYPSEYGISRDDDVYQQISTLYEKIEEIFHSFNQALDEAKINHGHSHEGNYFVEFIDLDYYDEMINQGYTVNTIPYDKNHFKFGLDKDVLENTDKYKIVVRLGDFDEATEA